MEPVASVFWRLAVLCMLKWWILEDFFTYCTIIPTHPLLIYNVLEAQMFA